jgi:excisionase family DNA binding protein
MIAGPEKRLYRGVETMAGISVREAARRFNVSRPTLVKHLKDGTISGHVVPKEDGGGWLIDPSELIRAGYGERQTLTGKETVKVTMIAGGGKNELPPVSMPLSGATDAELDRLKAELAEALQRAAVAEALANERAQRIEDLRRMLPAPDAKPRRSWWPWS